MDNSSETWSILETVHKYLSRTVRRFHNCFGCFRRKRVYPETHTLADSKIIRFQSNKLIRVIHLKNFSSRNGDLSNNYQYLEYLKMRDQLRSPSVSESDYTFNAWSKPLKMCDTCRTPYRHSWKGDECKPDTVEPNGILPVCNTVRRYHETLKPTEVNGSPIPSVEKFIEVLIREILEETFVSLFRKDKDCRSKLMSMESCDNSKCVVLPDTEVSTNTNEFQSAVECVSTSEDHRISNNYSGACERNGFLECVESPQPPMKQKNSSSCASSPVERHAYHNDCYVDSEEITIQKECKEETSNSVCKHHQKSSKPMLFFLHGVGCSADVWSNLLYHFAESGYEVLAPDMLGHGFSSTPDSPSAYSFHSLLQDALEIFDKVVGETKCVVIGHAFGCSLAAALARYRPQQVVQVILISGGGPTPLAPRRPDFRPPAISPWLQACLKPFLLCGLKRDVLYVPCGKHIETASSVGSGVPSYVLQHIARGQDWPEGDSAFHRRILVPTLLIHGLKDPYVTLVQECEMERTIPRSSLEIIENAGHFAMLETPGRLCHMIHSFVDWWNL